MSRPLDARAADLKDPFSEIPDDQNVSSSKDEVFKRYLTQLGDPNGLLKQTRLRAGSDFGTLRAEADKLNPYAMDENAR